MGNYRDFRPKDVVSLTPSAFNTENFTKIQKLNKILRKSSYIPEFCRKILKPDAKFIIEKVFTTPKTSTQYATFVHDSVRVSVQTRYLRLINRKPRHPLTHVFQ
jgi:hypothetical protein